MKFWLKLTAVAVGSIALGVALALILLVVWLHAPRSHAVEAVQYLVGSAVIALVLGAAVLLGLARYLPTLALKIGTACAIISGVAILVVLYTPWMMFASRSDLYTLIVTLIYFITISLAFAFIIATTMTRQLHALHEGAIRVAAGELGAMVDVQGADEVAGLARAFNRMSAELQQHFERERHMEVVRRDLIAAVSHDLRTPLTSIRAMVEAINDGIVSDPETVRHYLTLIQRESVHLGRLIDDLFELSRIESGNLELHLAAVPLAELVMETVDGMRVQAEERDVLLEAACAPDVPRLVLDGPRIQRVLVNLIQNALRHTPPGGRVEIRIGQEDGHVQLTVADTGEGIAPEDQPYIFDQFYRGEKSRSRGSGGTGLGLAIARGIVEAHRGSIRVDSNPGSGSRFVVIL